MRKWLVVVLFLPVFTACHLPGPAAPADEPAIQAELDEVAGSVEILDESAYAVLHRDARPVIRARGFDWSEGPVWIEDGGFLVFSDVPKNTAYKYEPGIGTSVYLQPSGSTGYRPDGSSQGSNGLFLDNAGRLVLMQHGDRRISIMDAPLDEPEQKFITLVDSYDGRRLNSPNDVVVHSDGSLYFTDPPYGLDGIMDDPLKELPFQGVFRLDTGGVVTLMDDTVTYPNGIGLSPDEKTLYVAVSDRAGPKWLAWDLDEAGVAQNQRLFFDATEAAKSHQGMPDGMAVHSSGIIFATGPGGVFVFSPAGEVLARVFTGRSAANCTLSADESTLYITADDTLMTLELSD